eukprot:379630_1
MLPIEDTGDRNKWIDLTKLKLKEREISLIRHKVSVAHRIIKAELRTLNATSQGAITNIMNSYRIDDNLIATALTQLHQVIDDWNGLGKCESRHPLTTTVSSYREYIVLARNLWDQKKRSIYGNMFWIHVFMHIHQLHIARKSILRIIKMLFKCKDKHSLIGIEVALNSKQITRYLIAIDHSLSVDRKHRQMSIHRNLEQ